MSEPTPIPVSVTAKLTHRLVKWEGEVPEGTSPFHPQVLEIVEIEDGAAPRIIYKRTDP